MSIKHYDIAIIGGSLAARIAAALLAKQGSKVFFLRHREATASAWSHSSLFLEKLLGTLGGMSCFMEHKPIQVLSRKARVTLSRDIPLDRELSREFGPDGPAVTRWLEQLATQGDRLEDLLWENGGLPWPSLKTSARFKLLSLRRKINWSELDAPLATSLEQLPQAAVTFVIDLLQGLALKKIHELSLAQAALLWTQVMRPEILKEPDFSQLLSKRFDQFHGLRASLEDLVRLDYRDSRWTGGQLKDGGQFTADNFLLGDTRWSGYFAPGQTITLPEANNLSRHATGPLTGQLSPLLASRVICGGDLPLRLAIDTAEDELQGQIVSPGAAQEDDLRRQLEPALPFARYKLSEEVEPPGRQPAAETARQPQSLTRLPLRIGSNLYCADNNALLAEMGPAGAALLGWTLTENLANRRSR